MYCDTVRKKCIIQTEGKTNVTFFLVAFSLSFRHSALRHVQLVSLIVSCLCYEATHGGEVHQRLLKAEHYLRLRKSQRCKFMVSRREFGGIITLCFPYSHTFL